MDVCIPGTSEIVKAGSRAKSGYVILGFLSILPCAH